MAENDIVIETILKNLERPMRSKAISDKHAWSSVSKFFYFGVENMLEPLQTDIGIGVTFIR